MKYFIFLFSIVAWGSLGLIIGKGVAGTNDPDIQTCTHGSEE